MSTITIPTKTIKDADLVLVPRHEYEDLIRARMTLAKTVTIRRSSSFRVPKDQEKFYKKLDKELTESLRDYYAGRYYGPFETIDEGINLLKQKRNLSPRK